MGKIREIERLRAIAVLLVVFEHLDRLKEEFPPFFRHAGAGVDLFFVISGYVVGRSFLRMLPDSPPGQTILERINAARPALSTFYRRRIFRIAPLALVAAFLYYEAALHFNSSLAFGKPETLEREIFAIVTLQYNYALAYGNGGDIGFYWSLAVEEHFYLLLPLSILIFGSTPLRRMALMTFGILLVVLVLRPYVTFQGPKEWAYAWRGFTSHRKFDFLFVGVLIYLCREQGWLSGFGTMSKLWAVPLSLALVLCIWAAQCTLPDDQFWNGGQSVMWGMCGMLVLLATFDRGVIFPVPGLSHFLEWVGSRSYGVYLLNRGAIRFMHELHDTPLVFRTGRFMRMYMAWYDRPFVSAAMAYCLTFAMAEVAFRLVENPLVRIGHRASRPAPAPTSLTD